MAYEFSSIEKKWQSQWEESQLYTVVEDKTKEKYYVLDMFPYPSGAGLHVGHPLGYIASDIVSRFKRMKGFNVLHPMGFDAFGLPAEQYAIKTGQHPAITTENNISVYKKQLNNIGFSYDWSREVRTCDPSYYKWTQWIFTQLFNHWFNKQTNKAEPIDQLITIFENEGNVNIKHAGDVVDSFTAEQWIELSAVEKENILQHYRLAFLKETAVNWCEELGTVLANEEVKDGLSARGGYPVVKKQMTQWFLRITAYADRLLQGLDQLDWSNSIKEIQRNWIGKSKGADIKFKVSESTLYLDVFTTRPDTIFGCSFMVIAPEHELVNSLTTSDLKPHVDKYVKETAARSERDRMSDVKSVTGVFTGSYCLHPFTGQNIPIWIADYVLSGYGTGAIMAVPGHDSRDHAFAKQFKLPITQVIKGNEDVNIQETSFESKEGTLINSSFLDNLSVKKAISAVIQKIMADGFGKGTVQFKLRDAGFGRQRYWGEPIPALFNDAIPSVLTKDNLPLELPQVDSYKPSGNGASPLSSATQWVEQDTGRRETDTMPGWAGSSWYFLRYMDPQNQHDLVSDEAVQYWKQVDLYIGGSEHATGHLLYSRFWSKFLFDIKKIPFEEPFQKMVNQGMIQGTIESIYLNKNKSNGIAQFTSADAIDDNQEYTKIPVLVDFVSNYETQDDSFLNLEGLQKFVDWSPSFHNCEFITNSSHISFKDGKVETQTSDVVFKTVSEIGKMSKSLYNVVNPDGICESYGADTLRLYEMFLGPITDAKPWSTKGIEGTFRFLKKVWAWMVDEEDNLILTDEEPSKKALKSLHQTIKKITDDIEQFSFNTSIAQFMICINELNQEKCNSKSIASVFVQLLAPYAPHIAEELWQKLGNSESIHISEWPTFEPKYLEDDEVTYPISINGKNRGQIVVSKDTTKDEVEKTALAVPNVQKWLEDKTIKKVIVVPGRIVNIVI